MSNLQTRIVTVLDRHMREWRATAQGAGYSVPPVTSPWLSELAEEIVAEVQREATLPAGAILVDASSSLGEAVTRTASGRVPAGTLRRPDTPSQRQPGGDLGEERPT